MGKRRLKESNSRVLRSDSEDSLEDFQDGVKCPFNREVVESLDDTMTEFHTKFGGSLSRQTVQKTMSTPSSSTTTNDDSEPFQFTKKNLFTKESMQIHSKNRSRKKSNGGSLKVIKDLTIKQRKRESKAEATIIARQLNPSTSVSKYAKLTIPHYPVPRPTGKSFQARNLSTSDTRDQNVKTDYKIIDLFSSEYKDGNGGIRFQCMLCYAEKIVVDANERIRGTFGTMKAYRIHFRESHGTNADLPTLCAHCGVRFANEALFKRHLFSHADLRTIKCDEPSCSKMFTSPNSMMYHFNKDHGETPYVCLGCDTKFGSNSHLLKHRSTCHSDTFFQCSCCRVFKTWGNLVLHIQTCHLKKDRVTCEKCARSIRTDCFPRHTLFHDNNKNLYCTMCEEEVDDKQAYLVHVKTEKHQNLMKDTFSSSIYPHMEQLDGSEAKDYYPHVEYDVLDKYNNNIFMACSPEKGCEACSLITVVRAVYYLTSKWIVPVPTVPFTCSTMMSLYMALLTNENFKGKHIQYRYIGQTQNTKGIAKRVLEHENGADGKIAAKIFAEMKGEAWKREYLFLYGCPADKKEPQMIEFGERNLIKQFQSQDQATNGFDSQDGGTLSFVAQLKSAGVL